MSIKLQVESDLRGTPPWLQHFFIHVVKRCCGILMAWIEAMQEATRQP